MQYTISGRCELYKTFKESCNDRENTEATFVLIFHRILDKKNWVGFLSWPFFLNKKIISGSQTLLRSSILYINQVIT